MPCSFFVLVTAGKFVLPIALQVQKPGEVCVI